MLSLVQARSQKFTMEGGCFGGLGAEPPAAGGQIGSGEETPSHRRHGGLGAELLTLNNFGFFCKKYLILGLFLIKIMLLKSGIEVGSAK